MNRRSREEPTRERAAVPVLVAGLLFSLAGVSAGDDEIGRLTSVGNGSMRHHYRYDGLGRITVETHVVDGRPFVYGHTYGYPVTESPSRGPGSVEKALTFPDGETVCYGYDRAGAQREIMTRCEAVPQPVITQTLRNARGLAEQVHFGNGAVQNDCYNPSNLRLERRRVSFAAESCGAFGGVAIEDLAYGYDDSSNVTAVTDMVPGVPATFSATYGYDSLDQLTSRTSAGRTAYYNYDAAGNLIGKEVDTPRGQNQSYGGAGRGPHALASAGGVTFSYDWNGNVVSSSEGLSIDWNAENMGTSVVKGASSLQKSFLGESVWKKVEGATTTYYLPSLRIENNKHRKFFGGYAERSAEDDRLRFYHSDHVGSSTVVSDASQTVAHRSAFLPYGETIGSTGGTFLPKYRFNFKEEESTGLYDYGARLYDPARGRWMSADSSLGDGPNRYRYVKNDPLGFVDPSGHQGQKPAELPNPPRIEVKLVPFSIEPLRFEWPTFFGAFLSTLAPNQRRTANEVVPFLIVNYEALGSGNEMQFAYLLATAWWETARFTKFTEPISHLCPGYPGGCDFRGRGFVHLTGDPNYLSMGRRLGLGSMLVSNPDMAADPTIAAQAAIFGAQEGVFRGNRRMRFTLDAFIGPGPDDWNLIGARNIINGDAGKIPKGSTINIGQIISEKTLLFYDLMGRYPKMLPNADRFRATLPTLVDPVMPCPSCS